MPATEYSADNLPSSLLHSKCAFHSRNLPPRSEVEPNRASDGNESSILGLFPSDPGMDIGIGAAALADVPLDSGAYVARDPSEYSFSDSFGELLNILETGGDQYETSTNLDLSTETSDLSPLSALLDATAPSTVENSLGPTCIPNISSLVSQLRASLCGEFFAHNMNLDRWDPCSSDLLTRQTARVFECIVDNPFTERTTLSTAAAQFYFGKRLSPTADIQS